MTEYVVTRWYRSPELLLSSSSPYRSVGCIFMELLTRAPLFPARDYMRQFRMIFELLGTPSEDEMSHLHNGAQTYIRHLPRYPKQSLTDKFSTLSPVAMDLVGKMLAFDARRRITVEDALDHPYFGVLHDVSDEPVCATPFAFDVEEFRLNREQTEEFVYQDSLRYNPNHQR